MNTMIFNTYVPAYTPFFEDTFFRVKGVLDQEVGIHSPMQI
jgi:hypothetical protein